MPKCLQVPISKSKNPYLQYGGYLFIFYHPVNNYEGKNELKLYIASIRKFYGYNVALYALSLAFAPMSISGTVTKAIIKIEMQIFR